MSPTEALAFVRLILQRRYAEIVAEDGTSICCRQGTQWGTRLVGGWFVPPDWLPKRLTVAVEAAGEHSELVLLTEETLGFGLFGKGVWRRYGEFVQSLLAEIELSAGDKLLVAQQNMDS